LKKSVAFGGETRVVAFVDIEMADETAGGAEGHPAAAADANLAACTATEGNVGLLEEVIVPGIHLDDPPAAGKGLGEGRDLGDQPTSTRSFGNRTRL
jgi:hypothetical protein